MVKVNNALRLLTLALLFTFGINAARAAPTPTTSPKSANPFASAANKAAEQKAAEHKAFVDKMAALKKEAAARLAVAEKIAATKCMPKGKCQVGNIGPGGGQVFYAASKPQPWGQYLEVAPAKWSGSLKDPLVKWCGENSNQFLSGTVTQPSLKKLIGTEIGKGKGNTQLMLAYCKSGAAQSATSYRGGGKSDWFLPSWDETTKLTNAYALSGPFYETRKKLQLSELHGFYWGSSEDTESDFEVYCFQLFNFAGFEVHSKESFGYVRPIRAFF